MPPKKTALCFEDLTVQQWEELMQEYIAQCSSTGDAGSKGMEVDVDDLGEVAKHHWELEGSQVVSQEKGKKKAKAKQVEMSEEEGNYLGTDELLQSGRKKKGLCPSATTVEMQKLPSLGPVSTFGSGRGFGFPWGLSSPSGITMEAPPMKITTSWESTCLSTIIPIPIAGQDNPEEPQETLILLTNQSSPSPWLPCMPDKLIGNLGETRDVMDWVVNALERGVDANQSLQQTIQESSDWGVNALDQNMESNQELREALDQNTLQLKSAWKYWEQEDVEE
ncbi:hypothetical protein P691DRAFT_788689 [Macrolepiota fuliginosa MF-IS2]|uniref:Uncharacterized protein n=1 Tax=Macrolepiota fuliginosa MF-IS2 TaxID=1400762 RepID=A0A9P6BXC8_9AGAR|nr:hypothetical protein P691DRAFT_788689 [Macrolepiota fuliginosa MF-IS2]